MKIAHNVFATKKIHYISGKKKFRSDMALQTFQMQTSKLKFRLTVLRIDADVSIGLLANTI